MTIVTGFDIETTGLDYAKGHRIIEVAALLYQLETQEPIGKFVRRINPERSIDPGAQAVHGISFEDLTAEPKWEEIAPKLLKVFQASDIIVAHNGFSFDMPFVNHEFARIGLPTVSKPLVDTMLQSRWATFNGKLPNLGELCFATGVAYDPEKAHGADYDVNVMMQAFFKAMKDGFMNANTNAG